MRATPRRHATLRRVLAVVALAVAASGTAVIAHAEPAQARSLAVSGSVDASGTLRLKQTLTFAAGRAPDRVEQRIATDHRLLGDQLARFEVSEVHATVDGHAVGPATTTKDSLLTVAVPTQGATTVTISYDVSGATSPAGGAVVFDWPVVQGLSVGAETVTGTVSLPSTPTFVDCEVGTTAQTPCGTVAAGTFESPQPTFTNPGVAAGETIVLTAGQPAGAVAVTQRLGRVWSLDHAFSITGPIVWVSLIPIVLGIAALWLAHRRIGRDRADRGVVTPVAAFVPIGPGLSRFQPAEGVRPGVLGTLADEQVDPVDVTATLLDLAVRGHLRIVELPRESPHAPLDWTFERLESPGDPLDDAERTLLDAVAPAGEPPVPVSRIGQAVRDSVATVQSQLYDRVVGLGWFARRPDATRDVWTLGAVVALIASVVTLGVLAAFTAWGLVGLALVIWSLALLYAAQQMPRRTASGSAALGGLGALAAQLQVQPTDQVPAHDELSRVLPYALVLGSGRRWLHALAEAAEDPAIPDNVELDWYHAPATWSFHDLPVSLEAFVTTVQGQLFLR